MSKFKDTNHKFLTLALFWEYRHPKYEPLFTIKDEDLEKDGKTYLIHFKEHFILTRPNAYNNLTKQDENRVAFTASILKRWNLIDFDFDGDIEKDKVLFIIKKKELEKFSIQHKIKL